MKEYLIQENDAGQRVDKFVMKTFKTMPKSLMYKYIRNKKIKVNRKRCEINQRLEVGDTMQCFIAESFYEEGIRDEFLHVPAKLDVVYEDENILIVNKPVGLLCQKDQSGVQDNLNDRILHYLYQHQWYDPATAQSFTPSLAHRIDRNTQGLMIAGKNAESLRVLNEKFRTHEIHKYYACIVEGVVQPTKGDLLFYLEKDEGTNKVTLCREPQDGYQRIESYYQVLETGKRHSLLEVEIKTGKSHQIRASLAFVKHPLLGDQKYGAKANEDFPYQALCSSRLFFDWQSDAGCLQYLHQKEITLEKNPIHHYFTTHLV